MRIVNSLLGVALVISGGAFALQGLNLAFNGPMANGRPSVMVGDPHWIVYGAIIAVVGLAQVIRGNYAATRVSAR